MGYSSPLRCGEIYFLAGQREKALEAAAQALTSSQQAEERGLEGWALYLLATIRANGDLRDWDQGEEHFRAALTRAKELSMRPSWPTATSVSASSTAAPGTRQKPRST